MAHRKDLLGHFSASFDVLTVIFRHRCWDPLRMVLKVQVVNGEPLSDVGLRGQSVG